MRMNSIKLTNNNTRWNEVRHGCKKLSKLEVVKRALNILGGGNVQNSTMRMEYIVSYDELERKLENSISSFIDSISIYRTRVL